jgi:hypothetical protein
MLLQKTGAPSVYEVAQDEGEEEEEEKTQNTRA